jgi:hypothetical protein
MEDEGWKLQCYCLFHLVEDTSSSLITVGSKSSQKSSGSALNLYPFIFGKLEKGVLRWR